MRAREDAARQPLALANQSEQQVLGLDRRAAELRRFVAREEQHAPRSFRVAFKHSGVRGSRSRIGDPCPHYTASSPRPLARPNWSRARRHGRGTRICADSGQKIAGEKRLLQEVTGLRQRRLATCEHGVGVTGDEQRGQARPQPPSARTSSGPVPPGMTTSVITRSNRLAIAPRASASARRRCSAASTRYPCRSSTCGQEQRAPHRRLRRAAASRSPRRRSAGTAVDRRGDRALGRWRFGKVQPERRAAPGSLSTVTIARPSAGRCRRRSPGRGRCPGRPPWS